MIYNLKEIPQGGVSIGAKAHALGKLMEAGFNVPEGYALSTEVLSGYLEYSKFPYTPEMYLSHNEEIGDFIVKGEFPPAMKLKLNDIYNKLTDHGKLPAAIRSSAICEDVGEHSMAGVFESFVNIKSYDGFEQSIKRCHASFFSDRALAMMLRSNVKVEAAGMGVIVQRFIEGDISGVMFTANTVAMDGETVVINAVQGPCSGFVDGTEKSSCYRVSKRDRGITGVNIPQGTPEIGDKELAMLVDAARKTEELFGCCQDVEWTIHGGRLYILQSRPITTFRAGDTESDWSIPEEDAEKTWALSAHDPMTPLVEELIFIYNEGITKGMIESSKGRGYFTKVLNGYAYNYFAPRDLDKRKVFREKLDSMNSEGKNIFQDVVLPQLMQCRQELRRFINRHLQINELLEYIKKSLDFFQKAIYLHILAVDGSMYLEEFKKYCNDIMPGMPDNDFYDLVFQKSELAVEREKVLEMAGYVKSSNILMPLFESLPFNEILYAHLTRYEQGIKLLQEINAYLQYYGLISLKGHRCITSEVLQERPWEVLGKIRACTGIDVGIYNESLNKILENKKRIFAQITESLDEKGKTDFMNKLKAAEKSFLVNDDHCFYIDLTSQGYLRQALMKAGSILAERRIIEQPESIYFLKLDEIFASLIGEAGDLDPKISTRKARHERNKKLIPPEYLGKAPDNSSKASKADVRNEVLKGVSGLGRRVSGKVKVVNDNTKNHDIKEECILVLPNGHGCYFLPVLDKIKGFVYDQGSPFDHPGILAREFGIPSIYKTENATEVLKDGDLVELDGINGEVRIIARA